MNAAAALDLLDIKGISVRQLTDNLRRNALRIASVCELNEPDINSAVLMLLDDIETAAEFIEELNIGKTA